MNEKVENNWPNYANLLLSKREDLPQSFIILTSYLSLFHFCSHVHFNIFHEYPHYHSSYLFYGLFSSTDALAHLLQYIYFKNRLYLFWFFWHIIKVTDRTRFLRELKYVNLMELYPYAKSFYHFYPGNLPALFIYMLMKKFKLTW